MESMIDHQRWMRRIESALLELKKDMAASPGSPEAGSASELAPWRGQDCDDRPGPDSRTDGRR